MAVDGCNLVCKYVIILFNIFFALLGISFLGLGLWLRLSPNTRVIFEIELFNSSAFVLVVTVLIALGSLLLILTIFGDYGACSNNRFALLVFSVLLAILALATVVVGVLAYTNKQQVQQIVEEFYLTIYALYVKDGDPVIGAMLSFIHSLLNCCGMTGVQLIELARTTCPRQFFVDTCPGVIRNIVDNQAPLVMGVFLGTGALLTITLICSVTLHCLIRHPSPTQYIVMTQTSVQPNSQGNEPVSTSYTHPYLDPVFFSPLPVANIPPPLA